MSHTAVMRTPGTLASAVIKCRQRPPVPIQPTRSVSLAPSTLAAAGAAQVARLAAVVFRKERRERLMVAYLRGPDLRWSVACDLITSAGGRRQEPTGLSAFCAQFLAVP